MNDILGRLVQHVCKKLHVLGFSVPNQPVLRALLDVAYLASMKTEESRFIRGSLTYCNPAAPDVDPPLRRRADYPCFTKFGQRTPLTVDAVVKLSRAVDRWSGSIAVHGLKVSELFIWGVADQLVHHNVRLNREATRGFAGPGIVTLSIDGIGDISVYHEDLFLGRLRQNQLVTRESDALRSTMVIRRIAPALTPVARAIARALQAEDEQADISNLLFHAWTNVLARLCIGLRRMGTGGSLLITPKPIWRRLDIGHRLPYRRLGDAMILSVLDAQYRSKVEEAVFLKRTSGSVPADLFTELSWAEADAEDRANELTGAVKLTTPLAAADGVLLMDCSLGVVGFGVKLKSGGTIDTVYDGADFVRKTTRARKVELSQFGTRHGSMLRYCREDRDALGIVVSQDGHVRLIMSSGRSLLMWDNVKLLEYEENVPAYARERSQRLSNRGSTRRLLRLRRKVTLGYTAMPKTIQALFAHGEDHSP